MIDFIGLGAQKSATSWLFQCLREHPEICLAEEKEIHYFSDNNLYERGRRWYESHWTNCSTQQQTGEISTSYLSSLDAPARIKEYAPNVKMIALLRDPVDRAESHIRHLLSKKEVPEHLRLEEMLALRPDIFENGCYGTHLERYYEFFSQDQFCVDTYAAVLTNPLSVITRVDTFLNIKPHVPKALFMRYNSSAFRASHLHTIANKSHQFMKEIPGGKSILHGLNALGFTSAKLAHVCHTMGKQSDTLYQLTPADRRMLTDRYTEELQKLARYGIAFG